MQKNLELLLEIQAHEARLRELAAEIAALPQRVAAIETKLAGARAAQERAGTAQAGNQSERRQIEREIETLREKITKIRGHSADVKTNQEYKALLDEIAFAENQIAKQEELLLGVMDQADGLAREVAAAAAALETQGREVETEKKSVAAQVERDRAEHADLKRRQSELRATVADDWLRRFDRVLKSRGMALAAVDREACSGCRVRLRPQFLQEMGAHQERLFVCESCSRILYLADQPVAT